MSASYQSILWNRQKKIYDRVIIAFVLLYLAAFISFNLVFYPQVTQETLIIRSTATLAILLLHIILMIGPLARLNPIFLPLLYNRRHLGVTMFCVAAAHGIFSIIQFHSLGNINPILSVFVSNTHFNSLTKFPFQTLGFFALVIFFLMAITSHDFWLHNLGPRVWKTLHMLVYMAYLLVIFHVLLGALQYESSSVLAGLLGLGIIALVSLHLLASQKENALDTEEILENDGFIKVCHVDEIIDNRAKVVCAGSERIAVFKYDNKVSAVSNVCKHQNGPLGEGRIIDGCITCPWHGYQYLPHNGSSPPPFKEKVATFDVKIIDKEIWLNPTPYPDGTERPAAIQS
ncbi:MAG: ferric reductase-like transmembrane domain-containing protein [Bacteroidetes bacterium]|nr:ferric reductase-like transmembrane domain-containing protein [Bacteroidota bacterium]